MKTTLQKLTVALAAVAILAAPTVILAQDQPGAPEDSSVLVGTVKDKTASELTVNDNKGDTKVALTDGTTYKKAGQAATADDVTVGSRVMVKAKKNDGGALEAVSIQILGGREAPGGNN